MRVCDVVVRAPHAYAQLVLRSSIVGARRPSRDRFPRHVKVLRNLAEDSGQPPESKLGVCRYRNVVLSRLRRGAAKWLPFGG